MARSKSCKDKQTSTTTGSESKGKTSSPGKGGKKRSRSETSPSASPTKGSKRSQSKSTSKKAKTSRGPTKKAKTTQTKRSKKQRCGGKRKNKKKRPLNAFMIFRQEVSLRLRAQDPDISVIDVSIKAGDCWRRLPDETKDKYRKKACIAPNGDCPRCPHCKQPLPRQR